MSRNLLAALAVANLVGAMAIVAFVATQVTGRPDAEGAFELKLVPQVHNTARESERSNDTAAALSPAEPTDPDGPPWRILPDGSARILR